MDYEKEMPFGAFDSELMRQEISIPKGFTATIKGDKIILTKTESEDERIRKTLIRFHKSTIDIDGIKGCDIIAWLEKQGEQKPADKVETKFKVWDSIKTTNEETLTITKIDDKGYWSEDLFICGFDDAAKWELVEQKSDDKVEPKLGQPEMTKMSDQEKEIIEIPSGAKDSELQEAIYNIPTGFHAEIENDCIIIRKGERKPYGQRKECLDCQFYYAGECKGFCQMKRGEQKSDDKVEPKFNFKVGQWIVATGKCVYLIAKIDGFNVTLVDVDGNEYVFDTSSLEDAYLWTIKDAKDGDVLQLGKVTVIFKEFIDDEDCKCYCSVYDGEFEIPIQDNSYGYYNAIPATKEQRDTLMKAMTDAGYTFDFDKKDLKKVKQKPAEEYNGEDYGIDSLYHAQRILEKTLGSVEGYQSDDGILEHKCAITAVKKLYEQKPAWSEEDEEEFEIATETLRRAGQCRSASWLKSLKERMGG